MNLCKLITTPSIKLPSQLCYINKLLNFKLISQTHLTTANYSSSTTTTASSNDLIFSKKNSDLTGTSDKAENISRAMQYYLDKLGERERMMKFKTEEFEIGKRHLAKMMGENADTFTQADIDRAIEYLLPSGLFEKKARPFLRHPEDYHPKSKMAAFNKDGRPLSHLFYTGNAEFYQIVYDLTQKLINLRKLEDVVYLVKTKVRVSKIKEADSNAKFDMTGSVWVSRADLSKKLNVNVDESSFAKFLVLIQKLADHPMSKREAEYLKQFLIPFVPPIKLSEIPALMVDEKGRSYQEVETTQKTATIKLRLYEGTGKINIKSEEEGEFDISYFHNLSHREQLLMPFKVVDRINKFDMDIQVNKGGMSCLAKGIRYAISKALCSFVSTDAIEKLRLSGLLTKDNRFRERKKAGREGARRRYTWKKR